MMLPQGSWGKGDRTKSESDAAAAVKNDPDIRADFERYGVKL